MLPRVLFSALSMCRFARVRGVSGVASDAASDAISGACLASWRSHVRVVNE